METLFLKKHHDKRLKSGHLWVFSNELTEIPALPAGSIVELKDSRDQSYGCGFYNPHSLIAVRLLKTSDDVGTEFFIERIKKAFDYRQMLLPGAEMYRLVFGESDLLPGLIIDKYGDYFSIQVLSAGMEMKKENIIEALLNIFPATKGIIEKNTSKLRELEGLELKEGIINGSVPDEIICSENDIKYNISLTQGQKTGYFLDQKINRSFAASVSKDRNVLDCFCNQGGFALNTAGGGAKKITGVDISEEAVNRARSNALLNNFSNVDFVQSDVSQYLREEGTQGNLYDMIILDPPAFAKNRKSVAKAKAGYKKINRLALNLLSSGGILVSSSCSQHIHEDVFNGIICQEAASQNKQLRLIYRGMQAPDHPILSVMPETHYLKFFVYQVV